MTIVRIAPSPTGKLHLGTARTALFNFLFAKKETRLAFGKPRRKGKFILRLEDTDRERSTKEFEKDIIENLKWLGLSWDGEPYYQMERLKIYQKYADTLLKKGLAYYCYCSKEELKKERRLQEAQKKPTRYSGRCKKLSEKEIAKLEKEGRKPALRLDVGAVQKKFKMVQKIEFMDLIHGKVSFDLKNEGDFIIVKSDGTPIFHFAVVIDDAEMKITHIIRGEDHLSNTPKQILLQRALGFAQPKYVHLPLILNPDKTKMSKRFGNVDVESFRKKGYLKEAILNYLATLGWYSADKETVSISKMIKEFDIDDLQKSPAIFYQEKLDWLNSQWICNLKNNELQKRIMELGFCKIDEKIIEIIKERIKRLNEVPFWTNFFFERQKIKESDLNKELGKEKTKEVLSAFLNELKKTAGKSDKIKEKAKQVSDKMNLSLRQFLAPIRIAITYSPVSPPLFESMEILGKKEYLGRLKSALK